MRFFEKLKDHGSKILSRIKRGPTFIPTEEMFKKWEQTSQAGKKALMNGNTQSSVQQQQPK